MITERDAVMYCTFEDESAVEMTPLEAIALSPEFDKLSASVQRVKAERDIAVAALIRIRDYTKSPGAPTMRSVANAALEKVGIYDA